MKKFTLLLTLTLLSFSSFSQKKRANIWIFGTNAGLDFSTGTPTVYAGSAISSPEASAVMCDTSGNLLFYTDAMNVWNKNNVTMPNGTGLLGDISTTQGAVIVPQPSNDSLYYIFTLDETGNSNGLEYSIVNMKKQSGLGDVVTKNVYLSNNMTEKLTAVQDPFSNRVWIAAHEWGNNVFDLYQLTATGLSTVTTQGIGSNHTTAQIQNTYGQMKFSACGNRIGYTIGYQNVIEVFNFNTTTGVLSNSISIPTTDKVYGFEFSSDGNYIYATCYDAFGSLLQYDLTSGVQSTIIASKTILSTNYLRGLQMANNGRIYVCQPFDNYMGEIKFPIVAGAGCTYKDSVVSLDPSFMGYMSDLSLPNFVTSYMHQVQFTCPAPSTVTGIADLSKTNEHVSVFPNPSSGEFSIRVPEESTVTVYSATGAIVEQFSTEGNTSFGKNYAVGMYMLRVVNKTGSSTLRVIRE
ncbi:MAG: T9SS type A sorting domain-containing protein, partial [Bacteroidia bacterium]